MQLMTEHYKGIPIKAIQKILGNGKKMVYAHAVYKGKKYESMAPTKLIAVINVKQKLDKLLYR